MYFYKRGIKAQFGSTSGFHTLLTGHKFFSPTFFPLPRYAGYLLMGLVKNIRNQKTNFHIIKSFPVGYSTVAVLPPVALDRRSWTGSSTNS